MLHLKKIKKIISQYFKNMDNCVLNPTEPKNLNLIHKSYIIDEPDIKYEEINIPFKTILNIFYHNVLTNFFILIFF